ncbi:MAG: tRNA (pseudouridine(54)-N(1))-methyltransferase TrmY [Thermoplasmatota archaeon]
MRAFLVVGSQAATAPFNLNGLTNAGRMDVLCRCIAQSLFVSHGVRDDTDIYLLLLGPPDPPKALHISGSTVRYMGPDERNIGGIIRKALDVEAGEPWRESTPGVSVARRDLSGLLDELSYKVVFLHEDGVDIRAVDGLKDCLFVLGDHGGLPSSIRAVVEGQADHVVTVSPLSLQADQCITLVHNELDRRHAGEV